MSEIRKLSAYAPGASPPKIVLSQLAKIYTPWPTSPRTTWSSERLRAALQAQAMGQFSQASLLLDAMSEDDEIPGALAARVTATIGSSFSLRPRSETSVATPRRVRLLDESWPDVAPTEALADLLSDYLMLGVGVGTVDWDFSTDVWVPRIRALPPEYLEYDSYDERWYYLTREGRIQITPGDGKWLLFCQGDRPWMKGYLRALAALWRSKQLTLGDWARYCQKHGLPLLKAKMPIFRDAAEKDRFVDDLVSLQSEGVIGLPQDDSGHGYDVELLEATTVSWQTFQASLARADRKVQVMLLGGNASTETVGSTGSRNTAEVQARGLVAKSRRDARALEHFLRDQFIRPYALVNWGATSARDLPEPHYDVAPEADVQTWQNARLQFASTLKTFAEAGYSVGNLAAVARDLGLDLVEREPLGAPPQDAAGSVLSALEKFARGS